MTANFLKYFYTNDFDNKVILKTNDHNYTVEEIKLLVLGKINFLKQIKANNLVLLSDNNLEFFLNFMACVFSEKEIILKNDEKSINTDDTFIFTTQTSENTSGEFSEINTDKVIINLFTSGSSGESKCVKKTLQNLIQEAKDLYKELNLDEVETVISTTTYNHLFGLTVYFILPINNDLIINLDRIAYPEDITGKNLLFVTTPSFLEKMNKYNDKPQDKLSKIVTAGAKLKDSEFEFALSISNSVTEIYGSTESGVIAHREHFKNNLKLFRNVEIITNEEKTFIITNYSFENKQESNDIIKLLQNREIELLGRSDRILKIQENRISAQEIENILEKHRFVKEAYCFAQNDKIFTLIALNKDGFDYVFKNDIPTLKKELKNYARKYSEIIPQIYKFIDEIPKNERGKTDKEKIFSIFQINMSYPLICERKINQDSAQLKIYFYRHCNFFKGHFNEIPILPGVVQLLFASMMITDIFGIKCSRGQLRRIKFKNIIQPDILITLQLERKKSSFEFTYYNNDKACSSGVLPTENTFKGEND